MISILLLNIACALQFVQQQTIPWTPNPATSVDLITSYKGIYYLFDRTNGVLHVFDACRGNMGRPITDFDGCSRNQTYPDTNSTCDKDRSGPNGHITVPGLNLLWVGDGVGKIRIVNFQLNKIIVTLQTKEQTRADEFAFDAKRGIVIATFSEARPNPRAYFIDAYSRTVLNIMEFNEATDGIEQPVWNPSNGHVYFSVPVTKDVPGGIVKVVETASFRNLNFLPIDQCNGNGIAFGPLGTDLMYVGCSDDSIMNFNKTHSVIASASTGNTLFDVANVSGIDQVAFSKNLNVFAVAASKNPQNPFVAIVDITGNVLQKIPFTASLSHSVGVDRGTLVFPARDGIAVYARQGSQCDRTGKGVKSISTYPASTILALPTPTLIPTPSVPVPKAPNSTANVPLIVYSSSATLTLPTFNPLPNPRPATSSGPVSSNGLPNPVTNGGLPSPVASGGNPNVPPPLEANVVGGVSGVVVDNTSKSTSAGMKGLRVNMLAVYLWAAFL